MAWRNGADVDQELWPIEAFGGVSDEQFWDDLAADRPLATTARTAQADSGPGRRPAEAYPPLRPGAGDRTAVPAAVPAVQPVQPVQPVPAPVVQVVQAVAAPAAIPTQPYPVVSRPPRTATQPVRAARQPAESRGRRSAEAGGPGPDEDPLTSPAYSLRAKGAVDGHSGQPTSRSKDMTREQHEQYETALSKEMQAFMIGRATEARPDPLRPEPLQPDQLRPDQLRPDQLRPDPLRSGAHRADPLRSNGHRPGSPAHAGTTGALASQPGSGSAGRHAATAAYAYPGQSHGQPSRPMNTPPYGSKMNGYRHSVSPAGDPGGSYGSRGYNWAGGNGISGGNSGPRHAYPPVNGYHGP